MPLLYSALIQTLLHVTQVPKHGISCTQTVSVIFFTHTSIHKHTFTLTPPPSISSSSSSTKQTHSVLLYLLLATHTNRARKSKTLTPFHLIMTTQINYLGSNSILFRSENSICWGCCHCFLFTRQNQYYSIPYDSIINCCRCFCSFMCTHRMSFASSHILFFIRHTYFYSILVIFVLNLSDFIFYFLLVICFS